jgi:phosphoenolpyruvate carboxykinase (ATP)
MTISSGPKLYINLNREELVKLALSRGEGALSHNGALAVETGARTGRSPKDRFIVKDSITANAVDWGAINQPISPAEFEQLWQRTTSYLNSLDSLFTADLFVGADPTFQTPVHLTCELAWHILFADNLFLTQKLLEKPHQSPWTIMCAPNHKTDPKRDGVHSDAAIMLDFSNHRLLICGTHYAGEIKKGMFSALNFLLPKEKVLPMHCAANQGEQGDVALFFGLSGTGKTTLSADPERLLIGDDEHGWSLNGVFNFEGGCYAKCINLSHVNEPEIWDAIRDGAVMENVVLDPVTKEPRFEDGSLTQNTRVAYPLSHIERSVLSGIAGHPQNLIFLTCDLYGVLPPVARLTKEQAAYYFLSGYTALVGSTEVGSDAAIKPTFSSCFGAPFFSRPPQEYAHLLMDHLHSTKASVYLVNTGWSGGPYGKGGTRFSIPTTRAVIHAILDGKMEQASYTLLPGFNIEIPEFHEGLTGIEPTLLDPRLSWQNPKEYPDYAAKLIKEFQKNFEKFDVPHIQKAGPVLV